MLLLFKFIKSEEAHPHKDFSDIIADIKGDSWFKANLWVKRKHLENGFDIAVVTWT